jgi:crossover junction endodeoxyribonuclease RuvC
MITLGIDPGTARLGFGLVRSGDEPEALDFGVIETSPGTSMQDRLSGIFDAVSALIAQHRPDIMAVEQLFFARNVTTAIAVGQARGVVLLAAARAGLPVAEYSPSSVKQAIVGYGKADKGQMQEMVRVILGLASPPTPDDAADALAVAICHGQLAGFASRAAAAQ